MPAHFHMQVCPCYPSALGNQQRQALPGVMHCVSLLFSPFFAYFLDDCLLAGMIHPQLRVFDLRSHKSRRESLILSSSSFFDGSYFLRVRDGTHLVYSFLKYSRRRPLRTGLNGAGCATTSMKKENDDNGFNTFVPSSS